MSMKQPKLTCFDQHDTLHLLIAAGPEHASFEIAPGVTAELDEQGDLIGIEIVGAACFLRDTILESAQAKLSRMIAAPKETGT